MAGILDALAGSSDPSTADPNTGLVESQRRQLLYSTLGQTGAALLAAGAPQMPGSGQQANAFMALGNVPGNVQNQALQMQQGNTINQRNIELQRKNAGQAKLLEYVQTPEFKQQFDQLPPAQKAVAMAALQAGDVGSVLKALQEAHVATMPKFNPDGSFYIPSTGEYVDPVRGVRMQIDKIGQPGQGIGTMTGAGTGPGGPQGDDFLQKLSPGYANNIKAYAEGRMQISPMLARTAAGQKILSDIAQYDPSFDQTNYGQRYKAAADFAPQGKTGQAIIQNNTVIEHAAQLQQYARALDNYGYPLANSAKNLISEQTGSSAVTNFNQQKLRLVDEMAKLLKGGQGSEGEINRQLAVLHAAQSPEQLQAGIEGIIEAAESRKASQMAQYETAMGRKPTAAATHAYHNPEAEAAAATIKANPLPGSDRYKQMQADAAAKLQGTGIAQGSTSAVAPGQPARPPVEGARQAPDGKWYVADPKRPGKYLMVQ